MNSILTISKKVVFCLGVLLMFTVSCFGEDFVVFKEKKPAGWESDVSCKQEADMISDSTGNVSLLVTGGSMRIGKRGLVIWCDGARYTMKGTCKLHGVTFNSNSDDPLQFRVDGNRGYVYVKGKGSVITPDGVKTDLPLK